MAGFGVQPLNIVIGVGFRWFARFLNPPNLQFPEKSFFTPPCWYMLSDAIGLAAICKKCSANHGTGI